MKATTRQKNLLRACLLGAVPATVGFSGLLGVDWLESHRGFCNACHLPENRPLHRAKMDMALQAPPTDEAGVHFQSARSQPFSCATCHRGEGVVGRGEVLWDSLRNTGSYFFGEFEEPKAIARPVQNNACTGCHKVNGLARNVEKFHGIRAHKYPLPMLCTACHVAHAKDRERAGHVRRVLARIQKKCGRCHDVIPPTPDMVLVLQNFFRAHRL